MFWLAAGHLVLLALGAVATAVLAVYGVRQRDRPGAALFGTAMVFVTLWSVADVLALTETLASHVFWERIQWIGISVIPLFLFLFIAEYTGYGSVRSWRVLPLLVVIPAITLLLVWTNPSHHLMWAEPEPVRHAGVVTIPATLGPWLWVYTAYSYTLIVIGFVLLVRLVVVSEYLYFDQSLSIVVGILTPLAGNVLTVVGAVPLAGLDLTPHGFTVMGIAFGNAIFRYRLFDLLPATRQLGRQTALASLDDGVLIVDDERELLFLNRAAAKIFDCEPEDVFGQPLGSLLGTDELDFTAEDSFAEVAIDDRTYEVTTAPITDQHERLVGHTLLLYDVTARERRERRLRDQRDQFAQLEDVNRVIRRVNRALVGATTREELVSEVCETAGPYESVWLGGDTTTGGELVGMGAGDDRPRRVESVEAPPGPAPFAGTDADGYLADGADAEPARRTDGDGWVTVPLVHGRTVYGALVLQSGRDGGFVDLELDVLGELGEMIGHAIQAVDRRQLLVADAVVELEFVSTDPDGLLVRTADRIGPCTLDGLVPGDGGTLLTYISVEGTADADVEATLAGHDGVESVRTIDENGATSVEVAVSEGSLCCPIVECGGNVLSAEATDGRCRLLAEVAPESDIRTVVERVTESFPAAELRAKEEVAPGDSRDALPDETLEELTDRQQEVLEAALRSGYFEWPRESTAEEVADSLDISSPTLHNHLRKAENQILSSVLDDS